MRVLVFLLVFLVSLNVDLRVLTQPGATGNETLSLPANFDPKAIILWGSPLAAAGTGANAEVCRGFGTYRGSVVQHMFSANSAADAAATGNTASEIGNNALFVILTPAAPGTRSMEIDLVSMSLGAISNVVINWVTLHGAASVKINCLILGGSDITDALAFSWSIATAVATQDITVVAGFGQPDFVFLSMAGPGALNTIDPGAESCHGFGKKGEAGRHTSYSSRDGNTNMFVVMSQRSDMIFRYIDPGSAGGTVEGAFALNTDPATNWPTDGFQVDYSVQATFGPPVIALALKGTFSATTGSGVAPITGGLPVIQDLAHGSVPKVGLIQGWNLAADTAVISAGADLGVFFIGAGDGTVECVAGLTDDDALGTSDCNRFWTDQKVVRNYDAAAALQSEADGSISGNNFRLSWNDIDSVAREYQWLTMGDALAAAENLPPWTRRKVGEPAMELRGSYA